MEVNKSYRFEGLLRNGEWMTPAYVDLDATGRVVSITNTSKPESHYENIKGFAMAGIPNAHSHAFQYAMVGLTERHDTAGLRDDFWGWRNAMYELALAIDPDQLESIASMLYMEMLRHGYTSVAEFHYVHHGPDGSHYENLAELGSSLVAAAEATGIRITLIPIFYQKGGFGKSAGPGQRRFLSSSIDEYLNLLEASAKVVDHYHGASLASGIHSMRAVEPALIKEYCSTYINSRPFHIHVSEQLKEVSESIKYLGHRPIEWLLDNNDVNQHFNIVHATHLTPGETISLAKSGAQVVLCPSTEGNLGDGLFPLKAFQNAGGKWCIGTDSHIGINPFEELRILDYGQRVHSHQRNIFNDQKEGNSGKYALDNIIKNGKKALGALAGNALHEGEPFDVVVIDATVPILANCSQQNLASTIVYASDVSMILGTIISGNWVIKEGEHYKAELIKRNFSKTLKALGNR